MKAKFDFQFQITPEGIAVITLDRPDTLNSLTLEIYAQLEQLFLDLAQETRVKVVVLTGAGKGFCSGGNVEEIIGRLLDREVADTLAFTRMTGAVIANMCRLPKPILAAVNGIAAGAGSVLALASDMRLMADTASFAFLFTKVGLTGGDMGAAYLLPRVVGRGIASELLMLGDKVDAQECLRIGLANRVYPKDQLLEQTMDMARRLAQGPSLALAMTKRLLLHEGSMGLEAALEQEGLAQALMLRAHDHREFYQAWKEKRPPRFQGR